MAFVRFSLGTGQQLRDHLLGPQLTLPNHLQLVLQPLHLVTVTAVNLFLPHIDILFLFVPLRTLLAPWTLCALLTRVLGPAHRKHCSQSRFIVTVAIARFGVTARFSCLL